MTVIKTRAGETLGKVTVYGHTVTEEQLCDLAGIQLARTEDDYLNMPENGMYDIGDLIFETV